LTTTADARPPEVRNIYAIKYAWRRAVRQEHFYEPVDDPSGDMPMDYFVWLIDTVDGFILVDTGCSRETVVRRGRIHVADPVNTLGRMNVAPTMVRTVILTHLHWDHAGNIRVFDAAELVLQRTEWDFWRSPIARRGQFSTLHEVADLQALDDALNAGHLKLLDGDAQLVPGVSVHIVGGHTPGMQVVRVNCASGPIVLASDAAHYWSNLEQDLPFSIVHTLPSMYLAFDRMRELANGECGSIVPGHDPRVMAEFPAVPGLAGLAVQIA
jgi:glyoxylase-like metal-dependent hydrolase (beta-lactamase superfamily II)